MRNAMSDKVLYAKRGEVAYITLNRPEVKNAIDLDVHYRLREIWTDFRDDDKLRVAVLTGQGDAFCAGADLRTHVPEWADAAPAVDRRLDWLGARRRTRTGDGLRHQDRFRTCPVRIVRTAPRHASGRRRYRSPGQHLG